MENVKGLLHKVASYPVVYDAIQRAVGITHVYARINRQIPEQPSDIVMVDLGGGTGISLAYLKQRSPNYVCLDVDPVKLAGFRDKYPQRHCLLGDGTQLPLSSGSADIVLVVSVAHHLTTDMLHKVIQEIVRVLKPSGRLILLDPVWAPENPAGRLIWSLDRGSYPRTEADLESVVGSYGKIIHTETLTIFHRYFLCVATTR